MGPDFLSVETMNRTDFKVIPRYLVFGAYFVQGQTLGADEVLGRSV